MLLGLPLHLVGHRVCRVLHPALPSLPRTPCSHRLSRRRQTLNLQARRNLGYVGGTGKRDDKRHVLLTEDVAEAIRDVSVRVGVCCGGAVC